MLKQDWKIYGGSSNLYGRIRKPLLKRIQTLKIGEADRADNLARDLLALSVILNSGNKEKRKGTYLFYTSMGYCTKSKGFVKPRDNFEYRLSL